MSLDSLGGVLRHLRQTCGPPVHDRSDGELLECFVRGRDEGAFASLLQRHGPMVLGVCRRVAGNTHDAEDAFQATFLVLVRKGASVARRELLANWLYGVACRTALEVRKRAARQPRGMAMEDLPEPALQIAADTAEDAQLLDQALSRLPDRYRAPLVLCDLQGHSRREAAALLGIPEGTLSSRLAEAKRRLARRLARYHPMLAVPALAAFGTNSASAAVPSPLYAATLGAAQALLGGPAVPGALSPSVRVVVNRIVTLLWWEKMKKLTLPLAALVVLGALLSLLPYLAQGQDSPLDPDGKQDAPVAAQPNPPPQKETLRYDGKTFAEWQSVLHTELKEERLVEAIKAMQAFGINGHGKEAAEHLILFTDQYRMPSDNWVKYPHSNTLVESLGMALGTIGKPAEPVLLQALKSPVKETRRLALEGLFASANRSPQFLEQVFALQKDADLGVRYRAVRALGLFPTKEGVVPALKQAALDKEFLIREAAFATVQHGPFPPALALPLLEPFLWDASPGLRRSALDVFGTTSDEKQFGLVAASLLKALQKVDDDVDYRSKVIFHLGSYGGYDKRTVPEFIKLLSGTKQSQTRLSLVKALGKIGPDAREAVPVLEAINADPNEISDVRKYADWAVQMITKKKK